MCTANEMNEYCPKCVENWCDRQGFDRIEGTEWESRDLVGIRTMRLGTSRNMNLENAKDRNGEYITMFAIYYVTSDDIEKFVELTFIHKLNCYGEVEVINTKSIEASWIMRHPQGRLEVLKHLGYVHQVIDLDAWAA